MTEQRKAVVASFALAAAATIWAGIVAGPGLAIYLGAPLLACIYVPSLAAIDFPVRRAAACTLAIAVVLLAFDFWADVTFLEWLRCAVVIGSLVLALSGITNLLMRLRVNPAVAATFVTLLAIAWMTWPIWMSHALTQTRVNWLVWPHPLLAINGVLEHLGAWDHAPIAYRSLTILNQDIPYQLPRSILPATLMHLLLAAPLLLPFLQKKRGGSAEPPLVKSV